MLKLQITNERDRKESQNRERKRQCELERRDRIFNARNRKIGVSNFNSASFFVMVQHSTISLWECSLFFIS